MPRDKFHGERKRERLRGAKSRGGRSRERQVISSHRSDFFPLPSPLLPPPPINYRRLWDNFLRAARHLLLNVMLLIADRTCMCVRVCVRVCCVCTTKKFVNPRNWYFQQLVIIRYKSGVYHYMPYPRRRGKFFLQTTQAHPSQHPPGDRSLNPLPEARGNLLTNCTIESAIVMSFQFFTSAFTVNDFSIFRLGKIQKIQLD